MEVGKYTSIAPHIQMHNLPQHHKGITTFPLKGLPEPKVKEGKVIIGNDVWIGQGAILLGPLIIGDGAIIGSYAVVCHNVEPYSIQVGNPARIIAYRFSKPQINKLLQIQWWEWSLETINNRKDDFLLPINEFIRKYSNIDNVIDMLY
jgi:acetyltransferase-like isoleucine patch superfamily enzyme